MHDSGSTVEGMQPSTQRRANRLRDYENVRDVTLGLCAPLRAEDFVVQSMPDASPTKWHLGHTTWFFECLILREHSLGYEPFHPSYDFLFNSYYEALGDRVPRAQRGLMSRPTIDDILAYRAHVDVHMRALLARGLAPEVDMLVALGMAHEQQHQELILTDIKHLLSLSPLCPQYMASPAHPPTPAAPRTEMVHFPGGIYQLGTDRGFHYDNEGPRHRVFLEPFSISDRTVTCGEYLEFMEDGGYLRPSLWLSDGWEAVQRDGWEAPLYWQRRNGNWHHFTLAGLVPVDPELPICHVSYYEADAFARWRGMRLPTEGEWEVAACEVARELSAHNLLDGHPPRLLRIDRGRFSDLIGNLWEWTSSPYVPYPGYRPFQGALAEYNGKFMSSQMVLRGGSFATPRTHIRPTYRNFFAPDKRWQLSGFRLAR